MILELLIGLPAAGKSYYCRNKRKDFVIISSDAIREELYGDVNDQLHNNEVFSAVHNRCAAALKSKLNVIVDATNLSAKRRRSFIKTVIEKARVNRKDVIVRATVIATPFDMCLKNNKERERHVPEEVMYKMYKSFQPPHYNEGFNDISYIRRKGCVDTCEDIMKRNCRVPHDNPNHSLFCGDHSIKAGIIMKEKLEAEEFVVKGTIDKEILLMAARYHDLSKYKCKTFKNFKGEDCEYAHFYCHENVSAYDFIAHSSIDNEYIVSNVAFLIAHHMIFYNKQMDLEKKKVEMGEKLWKYLEYINICDKAAH